MFFACGIWCVADVSSVSPSSEQTKRVCSDEGLTLETSATHYIPQANNIPYQPLLIKPVCSLSLVYCTILSLNKRVARRLCKFEDLLFLIDRCECLTNNAYFFLEATASSFQTPFLLVEKWEKHPWVSKDGTLIAVYIISVFSLMTIYSSSRIIVSESLDSSRILSVKEWKQNDFIKKIQGNLKRTETGNVIHVYNRKNADHILELYFGTFEWNCCFRTLNWGGNF